MSRPALPNARQILAAARNMKKAHRSMLAAKGKDHSRENFAAYTEAIIAEERATRRLRYIVINGKQPPNNWNGDLG